KEETWSKSHGWPPGNGPSGLRNQDQNLCVLSFTWSTIGRGLVLWAKNERPPYVPLAAIRFRRPGMKLLRKHAGASRISRVWSGCGCGCRRAFYRCSASAREGVLLLAYPE